MAFAESSYTRWGTLKDEQITLSDIEHTLAPANDDLWVAAACVDRFVSDELVQRSLIELGIKRTSAAVERCKEVLLLPSKPPGSSDAVNGPKVLLSMYFNDAPEDAQLCQIRTTLLERLDRLNSFAEIRKELLAKKVDEEDGQAIDEEWEDDPWEGTSTVAHAASPAQPPIPLQDFLVEDIPDMACFFASQEYFDALRTLLTYHSSSLWPSRITILESIPCHSNPSDYRDFLPAYDAATDKELASPSRNWRMVEDWVQSSEVQAALSQTKLPAVFEALRPSVHDSLQGSQLLSAQQLTSWYQKRVDQVISSTGMLDTALALVQHGGSLGIPGLDELGEDLSLMTRLVYYIPQGRNASNVQEDEDWTLARWRCMEPLQVVGAYLAHSTADTVAKDISRLVMPFLFVLESRSERAGRPDLDLPSRLLHNYVLDAPLDIVAAIFEASKPTFPPAQRLIKNDEDIVRLALACLYGSNSLTEWMTMSRIFECLPAWDVDPDTEDDADEADATILSLGQFVTPSTAHPQSGPADLLLFFKPLPILSLSRLLDILDVHLESGEIFARWDVPAPLRWFLQSAGNVTEQRAWANRMARRTRAAADKLGDTGNWEWLLDDMLKLCGMNESGVRSAFGLLTEEEVSSVFFSGILSSGREYATVSSIDSMVNRYSGFDVAKDLIHSKHGKLSLDPSKIEDICLAASREFYDNASSANYKVGDMKLAYDW